MQNVERSTRPKRTLRASLGPFGVGETEDPGVEGHEEMLASGPQDESEEAEESRDELPSVETMAKPGVTQAPWDEQSRQTAAVSFFSFLPSFLFFLSFLFFAERFGLGERAGDAEALRRGVSARPRVWLPFRLEPRPREPLAELPFPRPWDPEPRRELVLEARLPRPRGLDADRP